MAHRGGVVAVSAEAATNRMASVLYSSDPKRHHSKLDQLRPKKPF